MFKCGGDDREAIYSVIDGGKIAVYTHLFYRCKLTEPVSGALLMILWVLYSPRLCLFPGL